MYQLNDFNSFHGQEKTDEPGENYDLDAIWSKFNTNIRNQFIVFFKKTAE